jgi:replicative DNA helicase
MPSLERMLNIKIIQTGELKNAIEWGVDEDDFLIPEDKVIYHRLISEYTSPDSTGSIIGPELARRIFPQLDLTETDPFVTVDHLCHELRKQRMGRIILEKTKDLADLASSDPEMAVGVLNDVHTQLRGVQPGRSTDVGIGKGFTKVAGRYQKMKSGENVGVMPWPWKPLQDNTKGVQEDDYIVLYGRPKSMKTWVLVFLIFWAVSHDVRIIFYTKEMTDLNLYMRLAACFLHVIYDQLRLGYLTPEKEEELMILREWADKIEKDTQQVICLSAKDANGHDTVSWLKGKVEKYEAQLAFIDGIYLMSVDTRKTLKDNERVMYISREVREMILHTHVPVIATIQANRKAEGHNEANLDEIAFSDALSQDCTIAARVIKSKNEVPNTVSLVMGGLREFDMVGFKMYAVPCVDFSYHSMLTAKDVEKAKEDDEGADDDDKKKGGRKGKPKATVPAKAQSPGPDKEQLDKSRQAHLNNLPR